MASKTISLDEDAYEKLKAQKKAGESFSDVVHRLVEPDQPKLTDLVGLFDEETAEDVRSVVRRMRREDVRLAEERWEEH